MKDKGYLAANIEECKLGEWYFTLELNSPQTLVSVPPNFLLFMVTDQVLLSIVF